MMRLDVGIGDIMIFAVFTHVQEAGDTRDSCSSGFSSQTDGSGQHL